MRFLYLPPYGEPICLHYGDLSVSFTDTIDSSMNCIEIATREYRTET